VTIVLGVILIVVLLGPILIRPIEHNLELFFLIAGVSAAIAGGQFGWPMIEQALIPGNIPNIVAANRLGVSSREWARLGLLIGLPLMVLCFVWSLIV
jgi:predicted cation transporter